MFNSTISVQVELSPGQTVVAGTTLDYALVREAWAPIDHPSRGADPFTARMFCTPPPEVRRVMMLRKDAAKLIAEELTAIILEQMKSLDTEMGYAR